MNGYAALTFFLLLRCFGSCRFLYRGSFGRRVLRHTADRNSIPRYRKPPRYPPRRPFSRRSSARGGFRRLPYGRRLSRVRFPPPRAETGEPPLTSPPCAEGKRVLGVRFGRVRFNTHTLVLRPRKCASWKAKQGGVSAFLKPTDTKFNLLCSWVCNFFLTFKHFRCIIGLRSTGEAPTSLVKAGPIVQGRSVVADLCSEP